jgi:hypothetical protein
MDPEPGLQWEGLQPLFFLTPYTLQRAFTPTGALDVDQKLHKLVIIKKT